MPGHYGMKKVTGKKSSDMLKQKLKKKAPKTAGSAKLRTSFPTKAALKKKLGKK